MGDVNFYNTKFDEMVFFVQPSWEVKERIPYFLFFRCNGDFGWKPKNNLNEINQVKVTLHFPAHREIKHSNHSNYFCLAKVVYLLQEYEM